jgi:hypothetical protein
MGEILEMVDGDRLDFRIFGEARGAAPLLFLSWLHTFTPTFFASRPSVLQFAPAARPFGRKFFSLSVPGFSWVDDPTALEQELFVCVFSLVFICLLAFVSLFFVFFFVALDLCFLFRASLLTFVSGSSRAAMQLMPNSLELQTPHPALLLNSNMSLIR